jgi:arginine decarboxylase-like protein
MGAGMRYLDVGGGLGIDYDGSQTNFEFSTNYTLQEYAANVVYKIMSVCDEENVPHPTIVTESGRAMVAQQSVLVFDVLGANRLDRFTVPASLETVSKDEHGEVPRPIVDLYEAYNSITERRLLECYHDALQSRDEAMNLFSVGYMSLEHRALAERMFWATCSASAKRRRKVAVERVSELGRSSESMSRSRRWRRATLPRMTSWLSSWVICRSSIEKPATARVMRSRPSPVCSML